MSLFSRVIGTVSSFFQIGGPGGPRLKNDTGDIDARNSGDSAYVNVRGADPVAANDFVTLEYANDNYALPAHAWGQALGTSVSSTQFVVLAQQVITPKLYQCVRVIGTGSVQNGVPGSLILNLAVGYAVNPTTPAEEYEGDPSGILCTGTVGGGTTIGTTISISYNITGLTPGTTYLVAIMGQASAAGLTVNADGIQIDLQECES